MRKPPGHVETVNEYVENTISNYANIVPDPLRLVFKKKTAFNHLFLKDNLVK